MAILAFVAIVAIFVWEIGFTIGALWASWTTKFDEGSWALIYRVWQSFAWPYYFPLYIKNKYIKK